MDPQQSIDKKKYESGIFKKPKLPTGEAPSLSASQKLRKAMVLGFSPVPGIKLHRIFSGHTRGVNRVSYSRDGKYLASPSDDMTVRIWDEGRGECIAVLKGHTASVICTQFSPDGKLLASSSADTDVIIWDVERKAIFKQLSGHTNQVNSVTWSPNSQFLASGSTDGTIRIWNTVTWQLHIVFNIEDVGPPVITDLVWLPNESEKLVSVIGHNPSTVMVWDVKNKTREWSFGISQGFTNRIVFSEA